MAGGDVTPATPAGNSDVVAAIDSVLTRYFNLEIALVGGSGPEMTVTRERLAEEVARAAARAATTTERELLAEVRERLLNLAAGMHLSAGATAPSKKSEIERGCADAVTGIALSIPADLLEGDGDD